MAVYKRTYTTYAGMLTGQLWRFTVLPRYLLQNAFESRFVTAFFTLCFVPHVVALCIIYLRNNSVLMEYLRLQGAAPFLTLLTIDGTFFYYLFAAQTFLSFFLITFIGPGLISPDLANNALPLYLSRPFSRAEYVCGKIAVLFALTSLITWVPGLLLIGVQTDLAGFAWLGEHMRLPAGIVVGSILWIMTVALIALALSAWVKSKPIATASLFGVFFTAGAFGQIANGVLELNPRWGDLLNLAATMRGLWNWLLLNESTFGRVVMMTRGPGRRMGAFRGMTEGLPAWSGLVVLLGFCAVSLYLLAKKIRAVEVVR